MVFLVVVAGKAGLTCGAIPCMGHMAGGAENVDVFVFLVEAGEIGVA